MTVVGRVSRQLGCYTSKREHGHLIAASLHLPTDQIDFQLKRWIGKDVTNIILRI